MPLVFNVLPHFFSAGLLTGIVLAMLLMLIRGGASTMMRIGAGIMLAGALLFVLSYSGAFQIMPALALSEYDVLRVAALAEALLLMGAGWWLANWFGLPERPAWRVILMILGGVALSFVLTAPLMPTMLLTPIRMAMLLVSIGGVAGMLIPGIATPRSISGHLAIAGLFAWGVLGMLLATGLLSITTANAILLTSSFISGVAVLAALATTGGKAASGEDSSSQLALQGADALPFHYMPQSDQLHVPPALARKLHFPADVLESAEGFFMLVHPQDRPLLEAALRAASLDEPVEMQLRLADGEGMWRSFQLRAQALETRPRAPRIISGLLMESSVEGMVAGADTADDENNAAAMLHDPLTGLPAQMLLLDRLEAALARARRGEGIPCLLILDIDRFRAIIDALGIAASDLLIVALARRLQGLLEEDETLARLPADQFALIIDAERHGTPLSFTQRIRAMLAEPFDLDGHEVVITASIGVVDLVAAMMLSPREAIRAAEIALFEARRNGPGHEAFYTPDMHGEHARLAKLEQELRRALKMGELEVHYQPVMWLEGRLLAGFEALLRWRHPQRGLIGPEEFLGLAQEIGLMREIGQLVLREAVRQLGIWQRTFRTEYPLYIAVNIASSDLLDASLADEVVELLSRENADPAGLKLEVTEHLLMQDPAQARQVLARLAEAGIGVFCDDFGTGHSSLARLRNLPFDALKIDRAFLAQDDPASRGIIAAVVELAHGLSMRVVAEGVEQPWQLQMLEALGCDMAQGYLLAEPLDAGSILHAMTEARRIAPFSGRLLALSHILLHDQVAPDLPEDISRPQLPPATAPQPETHTEQDEEEAATTQDGQEKVVPLPEKKHRQSAPETDQQNAARDKARKSSEKESRNASSKPPAAE